MGLVLVCPQCQAKVVLQSQSCPYCQADLRDVPKDRRRYELGQPGPSTPPSTPGSIPVPESASVPKTATEPVTVSEAANVKIRRPHVRRYAGPPVSETHPVSAKSPETAESKPAAKKAKKPASKKKK